jgi:hypothetical protein
LSKYFDGKINHKITIYKEAIKAVPEYGWGTIIGITPSLAIYYGECGERAAVLCKKA